MSAIDAFHQPTTDTAQLAAGEATLRATGHGATRALIKQLSTPAVHEAPELRAHGLGLKVNQVG